MTVNELAVQVRNDLLPLLNPQLECYLPETYLALKNIIEKMKHIYMTDGENQEITGPYGYKIPPLQEATGTNGREPPECCGG
ncbi:MAG: hypothetical protein ACFFFO_17695 [Candidatus Thorarchaeota archaeon]